MFLFFFFFFAQNNRKISEVNANNNQVIGDCHLLYIVIWF